MPLIAQTVHGKPITSGSISVPRAAVSEGPGAERDLRAPGDFTSLSAEERAARLRADRDELIRLNFRFVVLTDSSSDQWSLARDLGLRRMDGGPDLSLWEVPSEDSSR
jgi:hypothetical protein